MPSNALVCADIRRACLEYVNYSAENGPKNASEQLIGVEATAFTAGLRYLNDNARIMFK